MKKTGTKDRAAFAGVPATFELTTLIGAQNGLSYMLNNRNGHDGAATEVLFGKEGTYKTFLEKWKAVYDTGFYSPITSGVTAEFTSGRCAAMLASSSNLASVIISVSGEFEVGVAKVPMVNEKATGGTVISGGALFSFTDSPAVKTVLEYMISPDVQAKWSEATGYVPVSTKAYETEAYKAFLEKNPQYKVAIVHGQQNAADKAFNMDAFAAGRADILVSTTVIEVGVDVPNASVMVIESAERFGLSQLHQLRGRVGRGAERSYCILMKGTKVSKESQKRLDLLCATENGFELAEEDMKMRGPGDLEGTQQSGLPISLNIASLAKDGLILSDARTYAQHVLDLDPTLREQKNAPLLAELQRDKYQTKDYSKIS